MDFVELEAIEGLRWAWNSWPVSKAESSALVIPLSVMCTPLMQSVELPTLSYEPLSCLKCGAVLNPYARVDYTSRIWFCSFCYQRNSFPRSYADIGETNLPAELFPAYSTVEYAPGRKIESPVANSGSNVNMSRIWAKTHSSSSSSSPHSVSASSSLPVGDSRGNGPAFVFVVDNCLVEKELQALKNELLLVVEHLPENCLVGFIAFDSMVHVYDLKFSECSRIVLFPGERELSSIQVYFNFCFSAFLFNLLNLWYYLLCAM